MAKDKKTTASKMKEAAPTAMMAEETFALEYEEDKKTMRIAIGVAIALHIVFFLIKVPEMIAQQQEAKKPKVYVVQQVRFKPPPPKQQKDIPKARSKKVPIPDPTPDEPEPIRLPEEIDTEIEIPTPTSSSGSPKDHLPPSPKGRFV